MSDATGTVPLEKRSAVDLEKELLQLKREAHELYEAASKRIVDCAERAADPSIARARLVAQALTGGVVNDLAKREMQGITKLERMTSAAEDEEDGGSGRKGRGEKEKAENAVRELRNSLAEVRQGSADVWTKIRSDGTYKTSMREERAAARAAIREGREAIEEREGLGRDLQAIAQKIEQVREARSMGHDSLLAPSVAEGASYRERLGLAGQINLPTGVGPAQTPDFSFSEGGPPPKFIKGGGHG